MTEIYLHFLFYHYGLYANAPVLSTLAAQACCSAAVISSVLSLNWPSSLLYGLFPYNP